MSQNVAFERADYVKYSKIWKLIQDCIDADVKNEKYIFPMVPTGDDEYDAERNKAYRARAIYYNFTGRTHAGLVGQMFFRDPQLTVTPALQHVADDADGSGVSLIDQATESSGLAISKGRYGLLVDYPKRERAATKAELASGAVRPNILMYKPEQIINWRTSRIGRFLRLTLVVLKEEYLDSDDGFQEVYKVQYRVLRLTPEGYTMEIFRYADEQAEKKKELTQSENSLVLDSTGKPWQEIPFIIGGVTNNDPEIDNPPLYPLAELNIGHLRNSADYEEALHMTGQPTPWISGITEEHKKTVMGDKPVYFGSRAMLMLPDGGQAGLLQMPDASPLATAMEAKEKRAASLGAKLIEVSTSATTATFTNRAAMTEDSILSKCAKNVSAAYNQALRWCQQFIGDSGKVELEISTDYDFNKMTAQERQVLIAEWQAGGITDAEYRWNIRRSGIGYEPDKAWEKWKALKDAEEGPDLDDEDNPDDQSNQS